jgi:iron(III) transport system permease protein
MTAARLGLIGLLLLVLIPLTAFLVFTSLHQSLIDGSYGPTTGKFFVTLLTSSRFFENAANTAVYAFGSAVLAITFGTIQAWLAERTDAYGRTLLYLVAFLSLSIPYVLYTVGWLLLLGRAGPVNAILQAITGSATPVLNVYTMTGQIIIEGLLWTPVAFLLLAAVFRNADASLEEASLMSGASVGQTMRNISLRLAVPAIFALALLVFIRAIESFEVPAMVGMPGRFYVLTTDVYLQIYAMTPPNYGQAAALAVILIGCVALLLWLYSFVSRHAYRYRTVTGKGFRPRRVGLGRWRYFATGLIVLNGILIIGLPVFMLLWAALLPYYQPISLAAVSQFSMHFFHLVFESGTFRDTLLNTLALGIGTASAVTVMSALGGWFIARRQPGHWLLDHLSSAPLAFPAIVLGLGFLTLFLALPVPIYGTVTSLVVASAVAFLPYGIRYGTVGVSQLHPELEEASRASGAGEANTFIRVVLPLIAPSLIACWLLVFLLSVRAVSVPLVLAGPDNAVVSAALFDLWKDGQTGELAAMGLVWTAAMTVVSFGFFSLAHRFGTSLQ